MPINSCTLSKKLYTVVRTQIKTSKMENKVKVYESNSHQLALTKEQIKNALPIIKAVAKAYNKNRETMGLAPFETADINAAIHNPRGLITAKMLDNLDKSLPEQQQMIERAAITEQVKKVDLSAMEKAAGEYIDLTTDNPLSAGAKKHIDISVFVIDERGAVAVDPTKLQEIEDRYTVYATTPIEIEVVREYQEFADAWNRFVAFLEKRGNHQLKSGWPFQYTQWFDQAPDGTRIIKPAIYDQLVGRGI